MLRDVQSRKVVVVIFNLGTVHDGKPNLHKQTLDFLQSQCDGMQTTTALSSPRQAYIDSFPCQAPRQQLLLQLRFTPVQRFLHLLFGLVDCLACRGPFCLG